MKVEIQNSQLREIFKDLWTSLPENDKPTLVSRLHYVTDREIPELLPTDYRKNTFAFVLHLRDRDGLHLLPGLATKSLEYIRYVLAHELGHVYFQHSESSLSETEQELEADLYAVKTTKAISPNLVLSEDEWAEIVAEKNYMTAEELRRYIKSETFREDEFIEQQAKGEKLIAIPELKHLLSERQNFLAVNIYLNSKRERKPLLGVLSAEGKQTQRDIELIQEQLAVNTKAIYGLFNSRGQGKIRELLERYDQAYLNVRFQPVSDQVSSQVETQFHQHTFNLVISELVAFARIYAIQTA